MQLSPKTIHVIYFLLIWTCVDAAILKAHRCPLGFQLAFTDGGTPICYRLKEPEAFSDKFKDCTGNLYSSKLYHSLNFPKTNRVLWTEYKSLYPGGPFIDWSFTDSTGDLLLTTYDVKYDASLGVEEELCVVIDPVSNFTAARCDEKHYRFCFVKPYPDDDDDYSTKGCQKGAYRFYSPYSTCLSPVTGVGGGTVRATWRQAMELCLKRGANLLNKGWRYSNSPPLRISGALPYYPLGIMKETEEMIFQYGSVNDTPAELPPDEWNFEDPSELTHPDSYLGAIQNEFWRLVNSSFVFFDVICEQRLPLRHIQLNMTIDEENSLLLKVNDTIKKSDVQCFTDSLAWYPREIKGVYRFHGEDNTFKVNPGLDGYYWCIQMDFKNYHASESNRQLYIRAKDQLVNVYAVKIRVRKEYRLQNMDKLNDSWKKKLQEYIYYRTKFISAFGEQPTNITEEVLQTFKKEHPSLDWKDTDVIYNLKIKRLYLDAKTALVHVTLNPTMKPATPGTWGMLEVIFMKPAYFCPRLDSVPQTPLGGSVTTANCRHFTCVGDFNSGVQWVETAAVACIPRPNVLNATTSVTLSSIPTTTGLDPEVVEILDDHNNALRNATWPANNATASLEDSSYSDEDSFSTTESEWLFTTVNPPQTTDVEWVFTTVNPPTTDGTEQSTEPPTTSPPTTALPQQQIIDRVIWALQDLLKNDSIPLSSIDQPFDQVNDILEGEDAADVEIPAELLHLLDELGSRVQLPGGQGTGIAVRPNVAIMMADASPEFPVRGVRIAASDQDAFNNSSFGFIDSTPDESQLLRNQSEAVVYLPASVTATPRRVSFVAFRNQRAFPSALPVNSRVFSVNVENLTSFHSGEVIDIHLAPFVDEPERNQSRVCAFWQFTDNATGEGLWAQDGCRLVRAPSPGAMDICRCTHLTHFAEVLMPRTVFSEANEKALEVLTVVGCVMSIMGLALIALTASMFRAWRRDYSNKIWLQLCIAIFILVLCFLIVVFVNMDQYSVPCMLLGVALHYSVLASFCWMLVAAVLSYRRLVLVFTRDMSHKLLRASAFAWGTPCAIVGILLSVDPQSYQGQFDEVTPNGAFCYPSGLGLWLAVYTPIAIMLLANWTLFALIVRSVFASRRIQRHGDSNEALRCASVSCLLVFLFGLPWIFGLFAFNVVLAYLFTLTGTFQGFVLFLFFVVGNKKTRDLWMNKLKIKQTRKVPVTTSTYTNNRSTGPGWREGAGGAGGAGGPTIEAKTSKPRSLTSPDDSRFS